VANIMKTKHIIGLILIGCAWAALLDFSSKITARNETPTPLPIQPAAVPLADSSPERPERVKPGYYGAVSEAALDQLTSAVSARDEGALVALERQGLIFPLFQNAEVYVTGCHGVICSHVSFRYKGKTQELWTYREAIGR
jgi:hypothetical protein